MAFKVLLRLSEIQAAFQPLLPILSEIEGKKLWLLMCMTNMRMEKFIRFRSSDSESALLAKYGNTYKEFDYSFSFAHNVYRCKHEHKHNITNIQLEEQNNKEQ